MDDGNDSPLIVRFGQFDADLRSSEVRKKGTRVPLQGQPFQVLAILVEALGRAGHEGRIS